MDTLATQHILPGPSPTLHQFQRSEAAKLAKALVKETQASVFGVAVHLDSSGRPKLLAFATIQNVFLLSIGKTHQHSNHNDGKLPQILAGRNSPPLAGFDMSSLLIHIRHAFSCPVRGIDLSTMEKPDSIDTISPFDHIQKQLNQDVKRHFVDALWDIEDTNMALTKKNTCLRAWLAAQVANACNVNTGTAERLKVLNTDNLNVKESACIVTLFRQLHVLELAKPKSTDNEFDSVKCNKKGQHVVINSRYKTRIRNDGRSLMVTTNDGKQTVSQAVGVKGKSTTLSGTVNLRTAVIAVRIIGRDKLTLAEKSRNLFVLQLLRGEQTMQRVPLIQKMWFPLENNKRLRPRSGKPLPALFVDLNASQNEVVRAMTEGKDPFIVVQGPPGSGKTTTISAAVSVWDTQKDPTWIVAQSNVAVLNIAKSLVKRDLKFRLVVSKEFYVEWHEHLYEKEQIQKSIIRLDELDGDFRLVKHQFDNAHIVLCTLSMLSNPGLQELGIFNLIPVQRLVIDEASQINVYDYLHIFPKFERTLRTVVFFGDPQQLAPYGSETVEGLQSVFEVPHLQQNTYFLDTQYRMPVPLGKFISEHVYDSKLKSVHSITDRSCVRFINVADGHERKAGSSWANQNEAKTIVQLVREYYKGLQFVVITPYDGQRNAIERELKAAKLPWESRVFNIDSYQGNEADYVLVSVVRTSGPGFMKVNQRMNVMLTRARKGMCIITNKPFLQKSNVRKILVAKLARYWEQSNGAEKTWVDSKLIASRLVGMPGVIVNERKSVPLMTAFSALSLQSAASPRLFASLSSTQTPRVPVPLTASNFIIGRNLVPAKSSQALLQLSSQKQTDSSANKQKMRNYLV